MADRNRFGSLSLGLTHIRRQLGSQPAIVTAVFIAVLVAAVLLGSTPRLLEEVSSDDLAATVTEPHSANRNIAIERLGRLAPGPEDDPLFRIHAFGEQFETTEVPESVQSVIADSYSLFESPQYAVEAKPGEVPPHPFDNFLRFTYLDRIEEEMTLVEGRFPETQEPVPWLVGGACPSTSDEEVWLEVLELLLETGEPLTDEDGNVVACAADEINHYEVVVSPDTAEALGLAIGQQMMLSPDTTDSLYFGLALEALQYNLIVSISGIVELSDSDLEYWYGDTDLHQPRIQENADLRIIFAKGIMNPDDYRGLFSDLGFATLRYTYREFVSPTLIQEADLDVLASDLREFQAIYTPVAAAPNRPRVITQLADLLDDHLAQREETVAVMSTTVASVFVVAVAVILLLAVLMTSRQRTSLVYSRNRGASRSQMALTRIYEGIVLVVPAAVLGYLVADIGFRGTEDLLPYRITVALTAAGIAMVLAASWHPITGRLGALQRESTEHRPVSSRRIVAEILVLTLAGGSVLLLRRRGSIEDEVASSFDWLLAVAPVLLAIAVAIVTLWVFPYVVRALAWGAAQLRGLVGFIGFKRLLNRSAGIPMSLAVILICVSTAVFASIGANSVASGQDVSSYQAVGADFTVDANARHANLPAGVDLSAEAEESALATTFFRPRLRRDVTDIPTEVMALDTADYAAVTEGTAGDVALPDSLTALPRPGEGTEDLPMPAILADDWPGDFNPRVGDVYTIDLGRIQPVVRVVELRPRFPDLPVDVPFVVFNRAAIQELSDLPISPTIQYLRAGESASDVVEQTMKDQSSTAELTSRYELLAEFSADPFVSWVETGFATVFVFAGVFAIVAAISALALASARRRVDFAYLKTLGLNNTQATVLTIFEQLPVVLTAAVMGTLAGVGITLALEPALDYDSFTGNLVPTEVNIEWAAIIGLALAVFAALSAAIVIFVLATRRQDISQTLRVGDE